MIQHIAVAILMQIAAAYALRSWATGAAVASAWAVSREITQAEYRWIEQFGSGLRANMPWWGGFDPAVWQRLDPWLDWMIPSLAVVLIACAMKLRSARTR